MQYPFTQLLEQGSLKMPCWFWRN